MRKRISFNSGDEMPDSNGNPNALPDVDAFAVVVAANVPPRYMAQMKAGKLRPLALIFEQVGDYALTAGEPVTAPVRDLLPEEAIAVMQRAMATNKVSISVTFEPTERKALVQRV